MARSGDDKRSDQVKRQADEKARRLAEALRANLRRRKEQVRGRSDDEVPPQGGAGEEEK
ncbi:hypothetical protein [Telmatospirillum sp.]|uniref:hypothetical protein n=1 Tax=Telmatospirillum sp. TaxID=2079197 RepID=UPI002840C304|nr:hypothetical protein [Telmatospirillum sp.]MDR3439894.1 hypothetical protein [Telmatospirillum sp.]